MKKSADPLKRHIPAHPSKKFMNRYISLVWTQTLCFWLKCITYTVDNVHPPPQEVYEYIHIAGFWLNWIQYPVDNVHPPPPNPKRSLWRYKGTWFEPKLHVLVGLLRVILHASVGADWWRKHLSKKQEEMSDITI